MTVNHTFLIGLSKKYIFLWKIKELIGKVLGKTVAFKLVHNSYCCCWPLTSWSHVFIYIYYHKGPQLEWIKYHTQRFLNVRDNLDFQLHLFLSIFRAKSNQTGRQKAFRPLEDGGRPQYFILLMPKIMHHCLFYFIPTCSENLKSGGHILGLPTLGCQHSTWLCATFSHGSFGCWWSRNGSRQGGQHICLSICLSVCLSIYTYIENTCLLWHIQYTSIHIYAHIDTHTQTHRQTHAHTLDTASSGEQLHGAGWSETSHLLATKACLCPRLARNINHQR